jgi:hypothetical protein
LHPNKNSRIASWLPWMASTSIRSSIRGPISLIRLHDYDSNHENAELGPLPGCPSILRSPPRDAKAFSYVRRVSRRPRRYLLGKKAESVVMRLQTRGATLGLT